MSETSQGEKVVVEYSPRCKFCSGYEEKIERHLDDPTILDIAENNRQQILNSITASIKAQGVAAAEVIFESLKYDITEYILKHEFCSEHDLSVEMALWLEERKQPKQAIQLNNTLKSLLSAL